MQVTDAYSKSNNEIKLKWQAQLPVIAEKAIISGPEINTGNTRHLELIQPANNSYKIFHANFNDTKLSDFNSIEITDRQFITSINPVSITDDEQKTVLATVARKGTRQGISIILTIVGSTHDNKLETITEKNLGYVKNSDEIKHGTLIYSTMSNQYELSVLVLQMADGSIKKSNGNIFETVKVNPSCSIVQPFQLTEKKSQIYILCHSLEDGYILQPLS